jgi:hypothetical protein
MSGIRHDIANWLDGAGDAEFFDFGEEVGDDVVGVGGVEEAGVLLGKADESALQAAPACG